MDRDSYLLEHLNALLADRALQGADAAEEASLRCLLQHFPEADDEALDYAAAALDLALAGKEHTPLPPALFHKLQTQAAAVTVTSTLPGESFASTSERVVEPAVAPVPMLSPQARTRGAGALWTAALAASLVLMSFFLPTSQSRVSLARLVQEGALVASGSPGPHSEDYGGQKIKGEVIWDDSRQQGYLRLRGFNRTDPAKEQLQLWIFDEKAFTKDTPIDGGVFDVNNEEEVIIPINAKLTVNKPHLFAITVERPGGVVVSKRDPLIFVAKVPN